MSLAAKGRKKNIYQIKDKQTPHTVLQKPSPKACSSPLMRMREENVDWMGRKQLHFLLSVISQILKMAMFAIVIVTHNTDW